MREKRLSTIRKEIDKIDRKIIELLGKRMEIASKSRMFKEQIFDPEREQEVIENVRRCSHNLLRPDFSEAIYRLILAESRNIQKGKEKG